MNKLSIAVNVSDHVQGSLDAPRVLVQYGDYECSACGAAFPIVKRLQEHLGDKLLLFTVTFHCVKCIRMQSTPPRQRSLRRRTETSGKCTICCMKIRKTPKTSPSSGLRPRWASHQISSDGRWKPESTGTESIMTFAEECVRE